jgi:hypothetical protein
MPTIDELNETLLKELAEIFAETRKQEHALDANRKGIADILAQMQQGAPAYGALAMQGIQISNEMKQRERELETLKERRRVLLLRLPFFHLTTSG